MAGTTKWSGPGVRAFRCNLRGDSEPISKIPFPLTGVMKWSMPFRTFGVPLQFEPEGFAAISRWLSEATPPGIRNQNPLDPRGIAAFPTKKQTVAKAITERVGRVNRTTKTHPGPTGRHSSSEGRSPGSLQSPFVVPPLGGISRVFPPEDAIANANAVLLVFDAESIDTKIRTVPSR
jgi:hypothetical protein